MWQARFFIYAIGLGGSALALSGFGSFDTETWIFDLYPFDLKEAGGAVISAGANFMAMIAVVRGWGKK